jgi:hypothetical protein
LQGIAALFNDFRSELMRTDTQEHAEKLAKARGLVFLQTYQHKLEYLLLEAEVQHPHALLRQRSS